MNKFEELSNYKRFLDQGVITQEEYDEIKGRLLSKRTAHEHLDKGARAILSSAGLMKKKTGGIYGKLKDKGNKWIEKELEKDRISDEEKRRKKERNEQKRRYTSVQRKGKREKLKLGIGKLFKRVLICLIVVVIAVPVAVLGFYFTREKVSINTIKNDSLHGMSYAISNQFQIKSTLEKAADVKEIGEESKEYEIFDSSNKLVAVYSVEYLGEDVDVVKIKEKICRSMENVTVKDADGVIAIDGYYKKSTINMRNFFNNAIMRGRVQIYNCEYSSFAISYKCNIWNYDSDSCDKLFDLVESNQYKNPNRAKSLNVKYRGSYKYGYEPVKGDFDVEVQYEDGKKSVAEAYEVHAPKRLSEKDNAVMIECHGLKKVIRLNPLEGEDDANTDKAEEQDTPFYDEGGQPV